MPEYIVREWRSRLDQLQGIGQAEIYPAVVAKYAWAEVLRGIKVVYYKDNESARIALTKQYSPVVAPLTLLTLCSALDAKCELVSWYARVSTCCNPADAPSRRLRTKRPGRAPKA